ncbi:hypothetical protein ACWD69_25770 [Micromonospora chokoriensis]
MLSPVGQPGGAVGLHGLGDQLLFAKEDPYHSCEMDEYCEAKIGPARRPDVLSGLTGAPAIGPTGSIIVRSSRMAVG